MRFLVMLVALLTTLPLTQARAEVIESWTVRGWDLYAYSDDDGAFSHCVISADYQSGISLHFALQQDWSWTMGLSNDTWSLREGDAYPVLLTIDGRREAKATIEARTQTLVAGTLPDSPDLFERMRRGRLLEITANGEDYRFRLDGSSAALNSLADCVRRYDGYVQRPSGSGRGFSSGGVATTGPTPQTDARDTPRFGSSTASASTAQTEVEAVGLIASLIVRAGLQDAELLKPEDYPTGFETAHGVWTGPGYVGTVTIYPEASNPVEIGSRIIVTDAEYCPKSYVSGSGDQDGTYRVLSACGEPDYEFRADYVILPRKSGGFYAVGITSFLRDGQTGVPEPAEAEVEVRAAAMSILPR